MNSTCLLFRRTAVALGLALMLAFLAVAPAAEEKPSGGKSFLPAAEVKRLVEIARRRMKEPLEDLAAGKVDEDDKALTVRRQRGLALLIAAYNQYADADADAPRRAAQRDAAIQIERALRADKLTEALKLWQGFDKVEADKTAERWRALHDPKDREDIVLFLMILFRARRAAGLGVEPPPKDANVDGLEAALRLIAARPDALSLKPDELARVGYQAAVLAQFIGSVAPERKVGARDPEKWRQWSDEMREAGLELAAAARDQKADAVRAAARKINDGCASCHRVFRGMP
jgi:hypothetical protein